MSHFRDLIWNFPAIGSPFEHARSAPAYDRDGTVRGVLLAVNVNVVEVPTTALQLLVIIIGLAIVSGVGLMLMTPSAPRWSTGGGPPTNPSTPPRCCGASRAATSSGTSPGSTPNLGKDINSQFTEVKVPAGEAIVEQGDPATHFYVVKSGEVEVSQEMPDGTERPIRRHGRATPSARSASSAARPAPPPSGPSPTPS